MLKTFLVVTIIVTIIAFVILLFLVAKLSIKLGLLDANTLEAEDIQNAIDNGDFLACFIDNWASAIEVMVIIDIVLAILSLLQRGRYMRLEEVLKDIFEEYDEKVAPHDREDERKNFGRRFYGRKCWNGVLQVDMVDKKIFYVGNEIYEYIPSASDIMADDWEVKATNGMIDEFEKDEHGLRFYDALAGMRRGEKWEFNGVEYGLNDIAFKVDRDMMFGEWMPLCGT